VTSRRAYWRFYWPLALTGLVILLGRQFQNGVLARYEDAARELATWAFAMSVFMPFQALLVFVPQMANVLARSGRARAVCLRFTVGMGLVLTLPVAVAAFSGWGQAVVAPIFRLNESTAAKVALYLRFLTPLVLIGGLRQYYAGLLIQARRTGTIMVLHGVAAATMIGMLLAGWRLGWGPVRTLALAHLVSATLHMVLAILMYALRYRPPDRPEHELLRYREVLAFFWPVAVTSLMFAVSRPVLYAFLNRTRDGIQAVAATRVAFDFSMIFGSAINQFRHLYVTFARSDLPAVRRFMLRVMVVVVALMALVVFTPLIEWILRVVLGDRVHLMGRAVEALRVLCVWPVVMTMRNYFHGQLLLRRRTGGMAAGGLCRALVIYGLSRALYEAGYLDHTLAAAVLVAGFLAEAVVAAAFARFGPAEPAPRNLVE